MKNKRMNKATKRKMQGEDKRLWREGKSEDRGDRSFGKSGRGYGKFDKSSGKSGKNFDDGWQKSGCCDHAEDRAAIIGRNPVKELIFSSRPVDKIFVARGAEGSIKQIVAQAAEKGIPTVQTDREALDRMAAGGNHQGIVAFAAAYEYKTMEDVFKKVKESGEPAFILILDGIEDPHNLGAIIRTAECVGAHGVVIPKRRAVGLTEVVAKSAAGALEHIPCVRVTNIGTAIDELKEKGLWIGACDMGDQLYYQADLSGPIGIVIGNEGNGISRLVKEKCDFVVSMPLMGKINSLNASNAAAVVAYEVRRQREID